MGPATPTPDNAAHADPLAWFAQAFEQASEREPFDAARAALATSDDDGHPHVRFVLVKDVSPEGFAFFTNLRSPKASQLSAQPRAALAFHWHTLDMQVRIEGRVSPLSEAASDAYFATRPRESQLGAWASHQSQPIADRASLDAAFEAVAARFPEGTTVPRPPHWGGLRVAPEVVEFWLNRQGRMHDRYRYVASGDGAYRLLRLQP